MIRLSPILLAMLLAGQAAAEEWGHFEYDFDADYKPWQEVESRLPAPPGPESLHEFDVGGGRGHRFFLDTKSISAGADGVVRYTVVIRTAGGAENVSFEGMRCETGERKIYAFGHAGGEWSRNKRARWDNIDARNPFSYHKQLFFHYLCTVDGAGEMKTIRRAIERGGLRRGGD